MDEQLTIFDYKQLDIDTRSYVQTKTAEIRILVKQTAQGIIEIGQRLIEVKERLGHGQWGKWLEYNPFKISERTAQKWMRLGEVFKNADSADLISFQTEALCLLSSKSTPELAREEALDRAAQG